MLTRVHCDDCSFLCTVGLTVFGENVPIIFVRTVRRDTVRYGIWYDIIVIIIITIIIIITDIMRITMFGSKLSAI